MTDEERAYVEAQKMFHSGPNPEEDYLDFQDRVTVHLLGAYPHLNNRGILMEIIRRAGREL